MISINTIYGWEWRRLVVCFVRGEVRSRAGGAEDFTRRVRLRLLPPQRTLLPVRAPFPLVFLSTCFSTSICGCCSSSSSSSYSPSPYIWSLESSAVGQLRCVRGLTRSPSYVSAQALLQLDWLFLSSSPFGLYVWSLESSAVGQLSCVRGLTRSLSYASAQALLKLDWLFSSSSHFGLYIWTLESSAVGQLSCVRGLTRSLSYASAQALLQLDWLSS